MNDFQWTELRAPGEVTWARPAADGAVTLVRTFGGDLCLGRPAGAAGWAWQRVGPPPGGPVRDAAPVGADASGAVTLAVTDTGGQVWLYQSPGTQPWTSLGTPTAIPGASPSIIQSSNGGVLAVTPAGPGGSPPPALVVTDAAQQPWVRLGTDPGASWWQMPLDGNLTVRALATALASAPPWTDPQPHVIAVVRGPDGKDALRVAVPTFPAGPSQGGVLVGQGWTWHDPGSLDPDHTSIIDISATSFRDGSGRLLAAVAARVSDADEVLFTVDLVTGGGSDWSVVGLGRPAVPDRLVQSVIAVKGPDPQAGAEPVVVAAVGDHVWTRSRTANWTDRGANPAGAGAAFPFGALDREAAGLWAVGNGGNGGDLWTFTLAAGAMSWQQRGIPDGLTTLVGAYNDTPGGNLGGTKVFAADQNGALWCAQLQPPAGEPWWSYHGPPAPGVSCTAPAGVLRLGTGPLPPEGQPAAGPPGAPPSGGAWVFTVGSDGHLWARTASSAGWAWADHGMPGGSAVSSGTSPVAVITPAQGLAVHVLADDGRLWMRAGASTGSAPGPDWTWTDRGAPPGQLIFAIIGAIHPPQSPLAPVVAVVTGEGHVWASIPDGTGFTWTDLKAPDEGIFAGVGVQVPAWDQSSLDIAGLGQSGQVWTARWKPGAAAPPWTARGNPGSGPARSGFGVAPDAGGGGSLITVLGSDQQLWTVSTSNATPVWTRRDPPTGSATTSVTSGRLAPLLILHLYYAAVLNQGKRLAINGQL